MPVVAYNGPNVSTANGVATVFGYTFRILEASDLYVTVNGVVKTLGVDYTVSGVGEAGGGNVTFGVAPANGLQVLRARLRPYMRSTDYQRGGSFDEQTVDADFDSLAMQIQQLDAAVERSFKPPLSVAVDQVLSEAMWAARASKYMGFDAGGAFGVFAATDLAAISVSAYIATLIDDADAATARATLGAAASGLATASGLTQNTARLLGRTTAGVGALEEISVGADMALAAGVLSVSQATDTLAGKVELATTAETQTGTDTGRAITPAGAAATFPRKVAAATVSGVASVDIVLSSYASQGKGIIIEITQAVPATDDVEFRARTDSDGGASYDTGASDYGYSIQGQAVGATANNVDAADSEIVIGGGSAVGRALGNAAGENGSFVIVLNNPTDATVNKTLHYTGCFIDSTGEPSAVSGGAERISTSDIDAIQFFMESGNESLTYTVYVRP